MACSWMSKVRAAMAALLMAAALTACESLQSHVPPPVDGQVNTGPGGTTSAGHIRHNYTMQELVGDELGPTGGSLIAAKLTHDVIAKRAFEISCGPSCGSELDNWLRAERELRGSI